MHEDVKKKIIDFFKSKEKVKTKFYMSDIHDAVPEVTKKDLKKIISEMIEEKTLMYFSTGSTTMFQMCVDDVDSKIK
jgi:hypothetical protein